MSFALPTGSAFARQEASSNLRPGWSGQVTSLWFLKPRRWSVWRWRPQVKEESFAKKHPRLHSTDTFLFSIDAFGSGGKMERCFKEATPSKFPTCTEAALFLPASTMIAGSNGWSVVPPAQLRTWDLGAQVPPHSTHFDCEQLLLKL